MSQAGLAGSRNSGGGGGPFVLTITGNDGTPEAPDVSGNFNIITANTTVKFRGTAFTETQDFGLRNILLGSNGALTSGDGNNSLGVTALGAISSGSANDAFGTGSLSALTTGNQNVALGQNTANGLTNGTNVIAIGHSALIGCGTSVNGTIAIGAGALQGCTGNFNIGIGGDAMDNNCSGTQNVAIGGFNPLTLLTTGSSNVSIGYNSGSALLTGNNNVFLGLNAGNNYTTSESANITISNLGVTGESGVIRIGTAVNQTKFFGAGINGVTVVGNLVNVSSTGQLGSLAAGSTGQVLQASTAASPVWSTATFPSVATATGTLLRANGTNWLATTSTYPNTNAINTILYASAANVMSALATANNGVLATNGTGVPSITATPTVTSITLGTGTALSQYVEGTFTPTINGSTGTPTATYNFQVGTYTRIGNRVTVNIFLGLSSISGGSGNVQILGLPFSSQSTSLNWSIGSLILDNVTLALATQYVCRVQNSVNYVDIVGSTTGSFNSPVLISMLANNTQFSLTVTYNV